MTLPRKSLERLLAGYHDVQAAKRNLTHLVAEVLPVGTPVTWTHGRHVQHGTVVRVPDPEQFGFPSGVVAANDKTGTHVKVSVLGLLQQHFSYDEYCLPADSDE